MEENREDGEADSTFAGGPEALKKLREKLKVCQAERAEFLALSQRLKADYINLKRDEARAREAAVKHANQNLLLELIDLADSFELAMANETAWQSVSENWRRGVEYIYAKLAGVMENHGLTVIDPLDQPFDPESAHAVGHLDTENPEQDNKVLAVIQKGYRLAEKVIRPARVKVGRKI